MIFILSLLFASAFADAELDLQIRQLQLVALESAPPKRMELYTAGAHLFHNKILSGHNNTACVSCHSPQGNSADGLPLGLGEGAEGFGRKRRQVRGRILNRHTPSLFNVGIGRIPNYFWDTRVRQDFRGWWITPEPAISGARPRLAEVARTFDSLLAVQAIFPIAHPDEMLGQGSTLTTLEAWDEAVKRVMNDPRLSVLMKKAYPQAAAINIAHVGNAIAEFQRQEFSSNQTPWDHYIRGKKQYLSERAVRGAKVYIGKAHCIFCHQGPHLSTFGTVNVGVPQLKDDDRGEESVNPTALSPYAFRIAPLRNVGITAPYMHSGVFANLREVIDHYNEPAASIRSFVWEGAWGNYSEPLELFTDPKFKDEAIRNISGGLSAKLNLTEEEKEDLRCFVQVGLTDLRYQKKLPNDIADCAPIL